MGKKIWTPNSDREPEPEKAPEQEVVAEFDGSQLPAEGYKPTQEEDQKATMASDFAERTLDTPGAKLVFLSRPWVQNMIGEWLSATLPKMIQDVVVVDRTNIIQHVEKTVQEHNLHVQATKKGRSINANAVAPLFSVLMHTVQTLKSPTPQFQLLKDKPEDPEPAAEEAVKDDTGVENG